MLIQQFRNEFLRSPFLSFEIAEEIWICYIRLIRRIVQSFIEYLLELADKGFAATHYLSKSKNIMRRIEGVVPCASLMEARHRLEVLSLTRIERFEEFSILSQRTESSEIRTIVVLILERSFTESLCILNMSEICSKKRQSIVCNIILKSM